MHVIVILDKFIFQPVPGNDIFCTLNNIETFFGFDQINIKMLLLCCPFILPFLEHIINFCIAGYYFPQTWEKALIVLIPKISEFKEFKDLRPISILSCLSKVFEWIVFRELSQFVEENKILLDMQSGFHRGHSCYTKIIYICPYLLCYLNSITVAQCILLV